MDARDLIDLDPLDLDLTVHDPLTKNGGRRRRSSPDRGGATAGVARSRVLGGYGTNGAYRGVADVGAESMAWCWSSAWSSPPRAAHRSCLRRRSPSGVDEYVVRLQNTPRDEVKNVRNEEEGRGGQYELRGWSEYPVRRA